MIVVCVARDSRFIFQKIATTTHETRDTPVLGSTHTRADTTGCTLLHNAANPLLSMVAGRRRTNTLHCSADSLLSWPAVAPLDVCDTVLSLLVTSTLPDSTATLIVFERAKRACVGAAANRQLKTNFYVIVNTNLVCEIDNEMKDIHYRLIASSLIVFPFLLLCILMYFFSLCLSCLSFIIHSLSFSKYRLPEIIIEFENIGIVLVAFLL
jgi:hypothetical protein